MLQSEQIYIANELRKLIEAASDNGATSSTDNYIVRLEALKLLAKILN
jgi:hypothetical protein